ncbi:hypothetical protein AMS68_001282 [Peltaster fructicola]|uniref:Uncharacterized protein n=1 Tax=Peltaster fructicola TaxID=286661 RepID=A0A6H0XMA8_9PEZI|nr:hypothetical protein AMS68_001282 [Peltaster fructicola]
MASSCENITAGQDEKVSSTDHITERQYVEHQPSETYDFTGAGVIDPLLLDPLMGIPGSSEGIPWSFDTPTDVPSYEEPVISSPVGPHSHYMQRRSVSEPPMWHDNTNSMPFSQDEPHVIFHRGGKELGTESARNTKKRARRQEPYTRPQRAATVQRYQVPHPRSHPLSNIRASATPYNAHQPQALYYRQVGDQSTSTRTSGPRHLIDQSLFAAEVDEGKSTAPTEAVVQIGMEALREIIIEAVRTALHG